MTKMHLINGSRRQPADDRQATLAAGGQRSGWQIGTLLLSTALMAASAHASNAPQRELADLSLEELANIQITSVSKREEALADAPASVFVITGEDIHRSGAVTLPEALRLAPNLNVARIDARNYAISARGFNGAFANKLLVLIDGRTVYSPLFSGVFWDAQDVVMEDIERIEVISGPGATLWGANAVNGVINVITKSSDQTQGGLLAAGASSKEKNGTVRYGGALDNGGHYRVYGKYADYDDLKTANGSVTESSLTGWNRQQAGFRADWSGSPGDMTVQGDAYTGALHQLDTAPGALPGQRTDDIRIGGLNLLGRLSKRLSDGSNLHLQAYLDHTERDQPDHFVERLDTLDLEFQHTLQPTTSQNLVWGGGYRMSWDRVQGLRQVSFLPGSLNMHWANLFVQDEVALRPELRLTLGLKMENNHYTGTEWLPNLRLAWKPANNHLLWGSVSRSVRAPSRFDRDLYTPTNPPVINGIPRYAIAGGPDFVSEVAKTYELGYRSQLAPAVSFSLTAFYSDYDKLRTFNVDPASGSLVFSNSAEGSNRGIETWASWQVLPTWRLSGGGVMQNLKTQVTPGSGAFLALLNNDPRSYWMLRSSHDLSRTTELDISLRHTAALTTPVVPAYTSMDMRLGWKIHPNVELSVTGQNLLNASHAEFSAAADRVEIERSVFVNLLWRI